MKNKLLSLMLIISLVLSGTFVSGNVSVQANSAYTGNIAGGGFESEEDLALWTVRSQNDQTVSIDAENGHNGSKGALAINMPTAYYGSTVLNFIGKTAEGAEGDFDTESDYNVEMYIKTSEDFSGSVYMRLYQNGSYIQCGGSSDLLLLGSKDTGSKGSENWIKIKTSQFRLTKHSIQMLLYVNGTGKIWIDDITVKKNAELLQNGGFDSGLTSWANWGGSGNGRTYEISNTETYYSGGSLKLNNDETVSSSDILYMVSTAITTDSEKQYVFSGDVKTDGAGENKAFIRVYQYFKVESGDIDSEWLKCGGSDNAVTTGGTTDWQHFSVKLSGFNPTVQYFVVMVYMEGPGTVYYDNLSITEREKPTVKAGEVVSDVVSGTVAPMTNVSLFAYNGYDIYYTVDGTNPQNSSTALLYNANYGVYITESTKIKACAVLDGVAGEVFEFNYNCDGTILVEDFNDVIVTPTWGKASHDDGAMRVDFTDNVYAPAKAWNGVLINIPVDTSLLDANTLYNISVKLRTENASNIVCYAKAYTTINGIEHLTRVNANTSPNHQFLGTESWAAATSGIPTEWTEFTGSYKEVTTTIAGAGNSMRLEVYLYSSVAAGSAWIDDIKLIPVESSKIAGGSVKATGTDENGNTVYTAKADDGYTVGTITAKTCRSNTAVLTQTVTEISRTKEEVVFTVSSATEEYNLNGRYITVNFEGSGNTEEKTAIIEDDGLWSIVQNESYVTLDTTNKYTGSNSVKITGSTSKNYISTGDISIDGVFDYKLEFYVKTQDLSNPDKAFVNVFMTGHGSVQNELDSRWGAYVKTKNIISGIKSTQDWTRYELSIDDLDGFWPTLDISAGILGSTGTLWIDGVKLTALPYEYYPLSVYSDGKTFGNAYYKETLENFTLRQGFYISNNTHNTEIANVSYRAYNDIDTSTSIKEGKLDISLNEKEKKEYEINLDVLNKYGTYTIKFYAENERGYSYPVGFIRVAIIKDSSNISDSIFGVNGAATEFFDNYKATGITMLRSDLFWSELEAVEGVLEVPERYEKLANNSLEYGIDQMFIVNAGSIPSWYDTEGQNNFPRSDKQIAQFMNFTKMVVEHFKGRVKYYEFFNEADWIGNVKVDAETYGKVLKEFYKTVKEADPDAYVVAGATSLWHTEWAAVVFETAGDSMDYWAIHPYANPDSPENKSWFQNLEGMQALARQYTGRNIPFLLDELGWSNNESAGGTTEANQLKWFVRILAFAQSADYVEKVVIYNDFCAYPQNKYVQELRWGMFSTPYASSGYAKPFVASISNYAYMTNGYTFEKRIELLDGLYIFKYTSEKKDKDLYMLWTNDVEYRAKIINSTKNINAFDIFGNSLNGSIIDYMLSGNIGGNPIYLMLNKGESIDKIEILADTDIIGDANSDNKVDILDFIKVKKHLANKTVDLRVINVDYNGTQSVEAEDLISLTKQLLK